MQKEFAKNLYRTFRWIVSQSLDLYLKSNTVQLADVFQNYRMTCLKILDPAKFLSAPGWAWQAALKNTKVKLELLNKIDMLLMVKQEIRGKISHCINRFSKVILNIRKIMIKIMNHHILNIGM